MLRCSHSRIRSRTGILSFLSRFVVVVVVVVFVIFSCRSAKSLFLLFSELRGCVKVEVAILGSLSLISLMVSVDVKQH